MRLLVREVLPDTVGSCVSVDSSELLGLSSRVCVSVDSWVRDKVEVKELTSVSDMEVECVSVIVTGRVEV